MKKLLIYIIILLLIVIAALFIWFKYINDSGLDTSRPGSSSTTINDLSATILPMCAESLITPNTDAIYYVAVNEPGADNEQCDGLAPTNEGGNHCPFKDFTSSRVREKLFLTSEGNFGTKSVVLMNYNGEEAIIDGTCPTNIATCNYPDAPGKIWTIFEIYGSNVIVQGLTFDNAYGRNIQIGAINTHIRCNKLIGSYSEDSDSIKATDDKGPVYIYGNEFSGPNEQAIDGTKARDWIVENNTVRDGGGFGFKFGARNVLIRNNRFLNLK